MHQDYTLSLSSTELNQLLKVCYDQHVLSDATVITLITKINAVLLTQGAMRNMPGANHHPKVDWGALETEAADIYYRQRHDKGISTANGPDQAAVSEASVIASSTAELTLAHSTPWDGMTADNFSAASGQPSNSFVPDSFLGHIARSLETMANYFAQQSPLGFREEALHRVIYCDGSAGSTWYYRDNRTQQPVLIPTPVLTCKAQHLEFVQRGDLWKLRLSVQADRLYCLEADYNSTFSKALLLALASLEKHQLQRPLSLEVLSLSGSDTLTCRVYSRGGQVMHHFGPNPPWRDVARQAITNVEAATQEVKTASGPLSA